MNGFNDITNPTQYTTLTNTQKTQLKDSRIRDAKSLSLIKVAMIETLFPKIETTKYSKEAWDILEIYFKGTDKVQVVKL